MRGYPVLSLPPYPPTPCYIPGGAHKECKIAVYKMVVVQMWNWEGCHVTSVTQGSPAGGIKSWPRTFHSSETCHRSRNSCHTLQVVMTTFHPHMFLAFSEYESKSPSGQLKEPVITKGLGQRTTYLGSKIMLFLTFYAPLGLCGHLRSRDSSKNYPCILKYL